MLVKSERKKRNPALVMTVGALATVGVISIVRGAKRVMKTTGEKVKGLIRHADDCEDI